ncbi:MAG: transcriptional repressor [Anaerolineae bacterium]|nr:transcriptional repressor [Anaerolineae bacterium]
MACEKEFLRRLHKAGLRLTPQREIVLAVLHEVEGLVTAEEIHHLVQASASTVDISTVYRTLDLLTQFGFVAVIEGDDGQRRYELLGLHGPHIHLVCHRCGAVEGIPLKEVQPFLAALRAMHGFTAIPEKLVITGLCKACSEALEE